MLKSNYARTNGLFALLVVSCAVAHGDVLITYESDIDRDASTPDVIDLNLGEVATIAISLTALAGETEFGGGGFLFEGAASGGVVENGILRLSEFMWAEPLQDPGIWWPTNGLPDPAVFPFVPGALPLPATLATLRVSALGVGMTVQNTAPSAFIDSDVNPYPLAEGSDAFTVLGIPEPATAGLLIVAIALIARRGAALRRRIVTP